MPHSALTLACLALGQIAQPTDTNDPPMPPAVTISDQEAYQPFSTTPPTGNATVASPPATSPPATSPSAATRPFNGAELSTSPMAESGNRFSGSRSPAASERSPSTFQPSPTAIRSAPPRQEFATASPAGYQSQSADAVTPALTLGFAEQMAELCVTPVDQFPRTERLQGTPLRVVDLLSAGSPDRSRLMATYWQLAVAVADYRFAFDDEQFLSGLPAGGTGYQPALLQAAMAQAAARRQEARVGLLGWQERLNEQVVTPATQESLPWPADIPLVGPYRTKFDTLFSGRSRPLRLEQINRALPELQNQIVLQATAISAMQTARESLATAYRRGQVELTQVLQTHETVRQQRQKFLQTVLTYNQQIAEYALQVAGGQTTPQQLVATLIRVAPETDRGGLVPVR